MRRSMSIISVRSDFAAVCVGDFAAVVVAAAVAADDAWVEWEAATCRKFAVGPSLSRSKVESLDCEAFRALAVSVTSRDMNRTSCRRIARIEFVGWTCRRRSRVVACTSPAPRESHKSSSRWVLAHFERRKSVGILRVVHAQAFDAPAFVQPLTVASSRECRKCSPSAAGADSARSGSGDACSAGSVAPLGVDKATERAPVDQLG